MKKKIIISCAAAAALVILAIGPSVWNAYYDRKVPNFNETAELYVYPGTTADSLEAMILREASPIKPKSVHRALSGIQDIKPGHYTVTPKNPSAYVARAVSHGWQSPVNLVLSGTMRLQESIARKISNQMMLDSLDVISAMRDSALLAGYGFTPENVFALFIPDTYQVYWTDSMKDILDKQKSAYDAFWTDENVKKAEAQGLSKMEVSIVASIVNGETNHEPEMPAIAGVYLNRYHIGMKLQADPTIAYCYGYTLNRILLRHLTVDSPFNTYMHEGLPPAPICVPTKAALNAVLNPDKHGYLYFCASPAFDGTHRFAATLSEHNANAQAFQRELNARAAEKARQKN